MAKITSAPDGAEFEIGADETVLTAASRAGINFAHACGGRARCSTCRVQITAGAENCAPRTEAEAAMADRLGFADDLRLACQLRADGDLSLRRLVLDQADLQLFSQMGRGANARSGDVRAIAVFFCDIRNFTGISENLPPYDVMYVLNRYFAQVGDIIERHGGFVDKFVGDGAMALFGLDEEPGAPLRAVAAALDVLAAVDQMKPVFASIYDVDFDIRIGVHFGEAVIGSLGSAGNERVTAIGDVVNVASRIEHANKAAGTRLLISEDLYRLVEPHVVDADFLRVRLEGRNERITLYEIEGLTEAGRAAIAETDARDRMTRAGRVWTRFFPVDELEDGRWRILRLKELDLVIARREGRFHAFNNACPHLNLPFFDTRAMLEGPLDMPPLPDGPPAAHSCFGEDGVVVCRWHRGCFDLMNGEIRDWAPTLGEDGTTAAAQHFGDISKNRREMRVYPTMVEDDCLWIALE